MVGHTGIPEAILIAVQAVDESVAQLLTAIRELNGIAVITADHGNADEMFTVKNGKKQISTAIL